MKVEQRAVRMVLVNDEMLRAIVIDRLEDNPNGFQRPLDESKVAGVMELVGRGLSIPPILVAEVDGKLYNTDGQHRLEARRRLTFPLFAQISTMTRTEAKEEFVEHNSRASKVSRKHRVLVDPGSYATGVRQISKTYDADVIQVEALLRGITSGRSRNYEVSFGEFQLAREILGFWTKDSRWDPVVLRGDKKNVYSTPAVLVMVGSLCKDSGQDVPRLLRAIAGIGFQASGPFAKKVGSSNAAQCAMKAYAYRLAAQYGFKK